MPAVQALIDQLVDREIEEANRILKGFVDKLLKPWYTVDGRRFDLPYLDFDKAYPSLCEQINAKKLELKEKD